MNKIYISNLHELAKYAGSDNNYLKMRPGIYNLNDLISPKDVKKKRKQEEYQFISFRGNHNFFDLNGVVIEVDTEICNVLDQPIHNNEFVVSGDDNTLKGLAIKYIGEKTSPAGAMLAITGENNTLKDCIFNVCGSFPYGYGDLFGKGGNNVINHEKQSGVLVTGSNTTLMNCKLFMHSFGHGYYIQGGHNHTFKNCYVEGQVRATDDILTETESPASDVNFRSVYRNRAGNKKITPGYMKSLSEDGFRTYNQAENLTFKNCTARNMRGGFELRTEGKVYIEGCSVLGTERGFWISSNSIIVNSNGDSRYGPLLFVEGDNTSVELELMPQESEKKVHALSTIHGNNHNIRIIPYNNENRTGKIPIKIGYVQPGSGEGMSPFGEDTANNIVLRNETEMPVDIGEKAQNCKIMSRGEVKTNKGQNNLIQKL